MKEFDFILSSGNDLTVFHAKQIEDGGMYTVSWDNEEHFIHYSSMEVEEILNEGFWVKLENKSV